MNAYLRGRHTGLQFKTVARPVVLEHEWHKLNIAKIYTKTAVLALAVLLGTLSSPSSGMVSFAPAQAIDRVVLRRAKPQRLSDWRVRKAELIHTYRLPGTLIRPDVYNLPLKASSARVSSAFGPRFHPVLLRDRFHKGLDLPRPRGTQVFPARAGKVVFAGWKRGFGRMVELRHADGRTSLYGHLGRIDAKVGHWIGQSEVLGLVGSSGLSTGPHLHFEVRDADGESLDPATLLGRR